MALSVNHVADVAPVSRQLLISADENPKCANAKLSQGRGSPQNRVLNLC